MSNAPQGVHILRRADRRLPASPARGSHNSYSMTSPLAKDGSDFPAKKFVTAEALASYKPVATLVAGQEFSWDLAGTATHNGCGCLAPALSSRFFAWLIAY